MQLVVQPQADHRSAEILHSVRQAFVDKGFDGASMQDLARAAGMSVGNFYRYFPSKSAIITGMITLDRAEVQRDFAAILLSPTPLASLRDLIHHRILHDDDHGDGALWSEIDAAARRSADIGAAAQQMESAITACLLSVFAAETGLTQDEAAERFMPTAGFIIVLFKAAKCLMCAGQLDQGAIQTMILRTIDQTLDDVARTARKA